MLSRVAVLFWHLYNTIITLPRLVQWRLAALVLFFCLLLLLVRWRSRGVPVRRRLLLLWLLLAVSPSCSLKPLLAVCFPMLSLLVASRKPLLLVSVPHIISITISISISITIIITMRPPVMLQTLVTAAAAAAIAASAVILVGDGFVLVACTMKVSVLLVLVLLVAAVLRV